MKCHSIGLRHRSSPRLQIYFLPLTVVSATALYFCDVLDPSRSTAASSSTTHVLSQTSPPPSLAYHARSFPLGSVRALSHSISQLPSLPHHYFVANRPPDLVTSLDPLWPSHDVYQVLHL